MSSIADVTITISGAGGTIHHEIYPIVELFKSKGYSVEVVDRLADELVSEQLPYYTKIGFDCDGAPITKSIKIVAKHLPWGG